LLYSRPHLPMPPLLKWTTHFIRGVASLEGDSFVVFYFLSVSEKRVTWCCFSELAL
jgi:hypothetical protein